MPRDVSSALLSKWSDEEARNSWLCKLYGYEDRADFVPEKLEPEAAASGSTSSSSTSSTRKCCEQQVCEDRVLQPMRWGLVPEYFRGPLNEFPYCSNNARSESVLQKPLFRRPMLSGRRCVVVADGFANKSIFETTFNCIATRPHSSDLPLPVDILNGRKWAQRSSPTSST